MKQDQRALAVRAANFMFSRAGQSCALGFVISARKTIPGRRKTRPAHHDKPVLSAGNSDVIWKRPVEKNFPT